MINLKTLAIGLLALSACAADGTSNENATGGNTLTGGKANTGGNKATGGNTSTGGKANTGGSASTGGNTSTGGNANTGGARTGGAIPSGGNANTGGNNVSGGSNASGGTSSTGGVRDAGIQGNGDAATGGANTGGTTATGGTSTGTNACRPKFTSGVNVAWFNYAGDIPNPDMTKFNKLFADNLSVGGRIVRWWFHTNGTKTPSYDSNGMTAKISDQTIADVKKILDGAVAAGQVVVISFWSFNMLKSDQVSATILKNNKDLLQKDANRQAYVDNFITPLVTALKGHPGIYAWEAFNEPEGMINDGPNTTPWTGSNYVSIKDIQKCVNWFAAAVHDADPSALFSNGAWTFLANTDIDGHKNYYSDNELRTVGGKNNGTLDFYQVHYYDNWGSAGGANSVSPFVHPASHWKLDKPIAIGEFWTIDSPGPSNTTIKAADLYTTLYNNGYQGAWAWQYANADNPPPTSGDQTQWPVMKAAMQNLFTAHPADLACK